MFLEKAKSRQRSVTVQATPLQTEVSDTLSLVNVEPSQVPAETFSPELAVDFYPAVYQFLTPEPILGPDGLCQAQNG